MNKDIIRIRQQLVETKYILKKNRDNPEIVKLARRVINKLRRDLDQVNKLRSQTYYQ